MVDKINHKSIFEHYSLPFLPFFKPDITVAGAVFCVRVLGLSVNKMLLLMPIKHLTILILYQINDS